MRPTSIPQYFSTLVLEGLLIRLLTRLEGALLSAPGVFLIPSIVPLSMSEFSYVVPPILSMDPLVVLTSAYGTLQSFFSACICVWYFEIRS